MTEIALKICGIQSVEEAMHLVHADVDYAGLNFVPTSKRCVSVDSAETIMPVLRVKKIKTVAIFQNQPLQFVADAANRLNVDYVQLHGDENAQYTNQIVCKVIKSIPVSQTTSFDEVKTYIDDHPADLYLLDRMIQGKGESVSYELARQVISYLPKRVFVAGGINPDNLAELIGEIRPFGIDIAGGIRAENGLDMAKVKTCLSIIRNN